MRGVLLQEKERSKFIYQDKDACSATGEARSNDQKLNQLDKPSADVCAITNTAAELWPLFSVTIKM